MVEWFHRQQPAMYKVCIAAVNVGDQPHCQTLIDMYVKWGPNPILNQITNAAFGGSHQVPSPC